MSYDAIPRVSSDTDINDYLSKDRPVIVSNCSLVSKSVKKWVPSYLEKVFGETRKLAVKRSETSTYVLIFFVSRNNTMTRTHTHTQISIL